LKIENSQNLKEGFKEVERQSIELNQRMFEEIKQTLVEY